MGAAFSVGLTMTIAIVGSRYGLDFNRVADRIKRIVSRNDVGLVVSGGAVGVDRLAESLTLAAGKRVHSIRPDWNKYGKSAGFRRNVNIIEMADEVHAFWDGRSRGTKSSLDIAKRMRKLTFVYDGGGNEVSQESHATPGRQSADVGTESATEGVPTQRS